MSAPPLRIVYFGTPDFAVPTLRRLIEGRHSVVGVVSQPDRGRGRGRKRSPSPVAAVALEAGLPLHRPEKVGAPDVVEALRALEPDLGVVAAFGQFLPKRVRELPRCGYLINAHASVLPRHRGAAPIARAILAGDATTGISVMRIEREMDAGPVALVRELEIGADEDTRSLTDRLAQLAAEAVEEVVEQIASERVRFEEQDAARATLAPKLGRADAVLDWNEPAQALVRRVRAMAPRPGAVTKLSGEALRILAARAVAGSVDRPPGTTHSATGGPLLRIATADGWLEPLRVQRAGGVPMDVADFLRGRSVPDGARLGEATPESPDSSASDGNAG